MASISTNTTGTRRVLFTWNGTRHTLYVGRLSRKNTEALRSLVEAIISARTQGLPFDADTASRIAKLSDDLHDRLASFHLVDPRPKPLPLVPFIDDYIRHRTDWKPNSVKNAKQARGYLSRFFAQPVTLTEVTEHDAKAFRRWLRSQVGENTTRRNCRWASQFFRNAVDRRLLDRNPFACLKGLTMKIDGERQHYIDEATSAQVLEACPSADWRLIFVLCRYAGLRCPSEVVNLRWSDVDWHNGRLTVEAPKTGLRFVPIFPEVRRELDALFAMAKDRATHILTLRGTTTTNLRTQFRRILVRAGVKPWPKLFHNLRATRETELIERFPIHVVCKWMGNSQPVAMKHYLQVTEDHWKGATADNANDNASTSDQPGPQQTRRPGIPGDLSAVTRCELPRTPPLIHPTGVEEVSIPSGK